MLIRGAEVVSGGRSWSGLDVSCRDGRIVDVGSTPDASGPILDGTGLVLAPGLIDLHVHGARGHDTLDGTTAALGAVGRYLASRGVTSWAPTTASHTRPVLDAALAAHRDHRPGPTEARSVGVHLEGPYLAAARCGAHDPGRLRDADEAEWRAWLATGQVSQVTLAPERDAGHAFARAAVASGLQVAVGHTEADLDAATDAIDAGVTHATHLFNGMPGLHHREPGVVGACLTDPRVHVHVIADLVHLHQAILRIIEAVAGDRVILISDSMRATGLDDGDYLLAEGSVSVSDGIARTSTGGLAGTTLDLVTAVRNYHLATGCTLATALHAASGVPARSLGLHDRGEVRPGAAADLVLLDPVRFEPVLTLIGGSPAYSTLADDRWIGR